MEQRGKTIPTESITEYNFDNFLKNKNSLLQRPILFKGVAKDWSAVQTFDFPSFVFQILEVVFGDIKIC